MDEILLAHQVVSLDDLVDIPAMDPDGHTHKHMLRPLDNLLVNPQQIASLEGSEAQSS